METSIVPYSDVEKMASAIVMSKLFGLQTKEQAIALMLIADAEGRHPASAAMDYHIISGRPSLRSETLLARFQNAGGKVEWHKLTDAEAEATFSHPAGGSVRISWDMARAAKAGLTGKDNWKHYPRQMLRSRVVSEGVTTVYPAVKGGFYTTDEIDDRIDTPVLERPGNAIKLVTDTAGTGAPAITDTKPKRNRRTVAPAMEPSEPEQPSDELIPPDNAMPLDDDEIF